MVGIKACMAGPLAVSSLDASSFEVVARFSRSFYLNGGKGLSCIGSSDLEAGPINVLCRQWPSEKALPPLGTMITVSGNLLSWDHGYIDLSEMHEWVPPACPPVHQGKLLKSLRSFQDNINTYPRRDGLLPLLWSGPKIASGEGSCQDMLIKIAGAAAQELRSWMRQERATKMSLQSEFPAHAVKSLVGLGPGLTPSGDDLLGGMMIALHSSGQTRIAEILWSCIASVVARTNDISRAHLQAAAHGMGADVIHQFIVSLISGNSLDDIIERLGKVGHSSGWDAVVGVLLVLSVCSE